MPVTRAPQRYLLNGTCSDGCSVGPGRVGEPAYALIHADIEAGYADLSIAERANTRGVMVTHGSVNRHRKKHLRGLDIVPERADFAELTELEALDAAIRQGQKGIANWKMTPSEWMKALELKLRLTEGTVFDGFVSAIASASQEVRDGDDDGVDVRPGDVERLTDAS